MNYPRCPNCPYSKDDGIRPSLTKPGTWYCHNCGRTFDKIAGEVPPLITISKLVHIDPDLIWTAEEITGARDRALAQFYAGLNDEDRLSLAQAHIDIHGDCRDERITIEAYEGTK